MTETEYHAQKGAKTPRLTYSIAKELILKSPLHAYHIHPLLGGAEKQATRAMDMGSVVHDLILGGGSEVAVLDFDSYRTKAAQEARDAATADGLIPMLQKDHEKAMQIAGKISAQLPSDFHTVEHTTEEPVIWTADNGVECQSRFDWVSFETGLMYDLKLTTDASPDGFTRKIISMGYDIQMAFYTMAIEKTAPHLAGRTKWKFIVAETDEPNAVSILQPDSSFMELGRMKVERALSQWAVCLETGLWPGYGEKMIEAPGWALYREGMEG